jgi:hypothetical protein
MSLPKLHSRPTPEGADSHQNTAALRTRDRCRAVADAASVGVREEEHVSRYIARMHPRVVQIALALAIAPFLLVTAPAQEPSAQDRAAAIKQALAENQAALRTYTWVETTEISLKGEVKKKEQKQCSYGADGKVQKTPIAGAAPAPAKTEPDNAGGRRRGGGRVKEAVIENKVDDMKDYMEKVAALVHDYVPPSPAKIQAAQAAGNVALQPGPKTLLSIKDYNKPGDAVAIGFDSAAKKLASFSVNSYVEKPKEDDVTLTVTFGSLNDGTSYPEQTLLDVKAKQIQVKVTNSGYKKGAPAN